MCDHSFLDATLEEECEPFDLEVVGAVNSRRITVRPSTKIRTVILRELTFSRTSVAR